MAIRYNFAGRSPGHASAREKREAFDISGTLCVRVDDVLASTDRDGKQEITGFWCTSMCSGEPIFVRLTSEEEELAENNRPIPASRRSAKTLVDMYPELANASQMPEESRPVLRCDRARLITDQEGRPTASIRYAQGEDTVLYTRMRTSWMVPYVSYETRLGNRVFPQEHMEAQRLSTVNLALSRGRTGTDYHRIFTASLAKAARLGMGSFARAASDAAWEIVQAWAQERSQGNQEARVGALSFTTWHPEESFRLDLADTGGQGRQALADFLSHPDFAPRVLAGSLGASGAPSPVSPECVLRFMNRDSEVCGVYRVTAYELSTLPALGRRKDGGYGDTPEGRADFILEEMVRGLDPGFVRANGVEFVDILPGRNFRADSHLVCPKSQPARGVTSQAALCQLKNMVYLALIHTFSPLPERRQNIGCAQAFMPRSAGDYALGWYSLRDGASYKNACLLAQDMGSLRPSAPYADEIEREQECLASISLVPNLRPGAGEREAAGERQEQWQSGWQPERRTERQSARQSENRAARPSSGTAWPSPNAARTAGISATSPRVEEVRFDTQDTASERGYAAPCMAENQPSVLPRP